MKLSKQSWHRKFYHSAYQNTPSRSFCQYFWKLTFSIIVLPLSWPSHVANLFKLETPQVMGIVLSVFAIFCGGLYSDFAPHNPSVFQCYWMGWVLLVAIISVIVAAGYAICYIKDQLEDQAWKQTWKEKAAEPKEKRKNLIKAYWKAFIEKNCPIIDWED